MRNCRAAGIVIQIRLIRQPVKRPTEHNGPGDVLRRNRVVGDRQNPRNWAKSIQKNDFPARLRFVNRMGDRAARQRGVPIDRQQGRFQRGDEVLRLPALADDAGFAAV